MPLQDTETRVTFFSYLLQCSFFTLSCIIWWSAILNFKIIQFMLHRDFGWKKYFFYYFILKLENEKFRQVTSIFSSFHLMLLIREFLKFCWPWHFSIDCHFVLDLDRSSCPRGQFELSFNIYGSSFLVVQFLLHYLLGTGCKFVSLSQDM